MMLQKQIKPQASKSAASLPALLESLGYQPEQQDGHELIYRSMLHDNHIEPSFCVNQNLNVWYDRGTGKGGNIIDFAMAYWRVTFSEALSKLALLIPANYVTEEHPLRARRRHAQKLPYYRVQNVMPLGNNPTISDYLASCGIWEVSQTLLWEVYYFVEDEKGVQKHFFAAGWQNELGSWEVHSKLFKGCLGHKAITFMGRSNTRLSVFEGYFNFLSWQTDNPGSIDSIIILNSTNLLESAIRKAKDFLGICLYFSRNDTGKLWSEEVIRSLPHAIDRSAIYKGHEDYNEMLIKRIGQKHFGDT